MELVPNKKRTLFVGLTSFFGLPCLCSPLIAFAIMNRTNGNWRDCYWFMTAFEGVCGLFLFFFYHPPTFHTKHGSEKSKREMIKELDFVGLFLFTAGSVLFLVGINFGGRHYPWVSAATLCPLIIGVVLLVMFGLWEVYGSPTLPIMPPRLFLKVRRSVPLHYSMLESAHTVSQLRCSPHRLLRRRHVILQLSGALAGRVLTPLYPCKQL